MLQLHVKSLHVTFIYIHFTSHYYLPDILVFKAIQGDRQQHPQYDDPHTDAKTVWRQSSGVTPGCDSAAPGSTLLTEKQNIRVSACGVHPCTVHVECRSPSL